MQANNKLELTAVIFLATPYRHCILHQITFQKIASTSEGVLYSKGHKVVGSYSPRQNVK